MKKSLLILTVIFFVTCCNSQNKETLIDASKVNSITITNKLSKASQKLKPQVVVKDKDVIVKIVKLFKYSEKLSTKVALNSNYGFFVMDFDEGTVNHYYTINYTVYNGVIIMNNHNGDLFKNDHLEGLVYSLFVDEKK